LLDARFSNEQLALLVRASMSNVRRRKSSAPVGASELAITGAPSGRITIGKRKNYCDFGISWEALRAIYITGAGEEAGGKAP
jgi:hypothetical protein